MERGTTLEKAHDRSRERADAQYTPHLPNHLDGYLGAAGEPRKMLLNNGGQVAAILGGWQLSGSYIAQTGEYLTPSFSGSDPSNTQTVGGIPDRIGNGNLPSDRRSIDRWFDASAFAVPPANSGRFGNSGRGIIVGPGRQTASAGLFKSVPIRERVFFRVQISFTNLFNHPNFDIPALNISAPASVATSRSIQTRDLAGPRNGLIGARIEW